MAPWRTPARGRKAAKLCRVSTRSRAVALVLSTLLVGPAMLAGCGENVGPDSASSGSSPSPDVSGSPSTAPAAAEGDTSDDGASDAPTFPANAEPDTAEQSAGASVTVTDIRLGRHDGFDRVVFEVGGEGTPGWDVRYVDEAASQGSGDPVEVDGDAVLQVTLTGAGSPSETGVQQYTGGPLSASTTEVVAEVVPDSTFEGTTVAFVGTAARTPFRVYALENPARVVVEVADAG
jgi:hypothetical protein